MVPRHRRQGRSGANRREARGIADFDVLCLQEIADNFPDPRLAGSGRRDQFARARGAAARLHGGPGVAVDLPGRTADAGGASAT